MKKVLTMFVLSALCAALIPFTPALGRYAPPVSNTPARAKFVPDEVIVQFRAGVNPDEQSVALNFAGSSLKEVLRPSGGAAGALGVARIQAGIPIETAIRLLNNHPAVEFAERNFIYTPQATSNDPYYTDGSLWSLYGNATVPANDYGSQAGEAWADNHTGSNSVYVGVIDDGIDFNHPDLDDNIWINPFDPVDGLDNDGNGYIDDIRGWDFFENNNSIYDGAPGNNIDAHGTHVAGTIGGEGNNGIGVAGVNWDVTIISGKFIGSGVGTTEDAIKAVDYFTDLKNRHGLNIVATNNSWGEGGYSQALHAAIIRGANAGILFVAAAGNSGSNNDDVDNYPSNYDTTQAAGFETPADYDAVIAVTSIDRYGFHSECGDCGYAIEADGDSTGPNFGPKTVDLGAPGGEVWSTTPNNTYSMNSGTSAAAAHVSGAAALYRSINPDSSASDVKNAVLEQTTLTATLAGLTVMSGRLNVSTFGLPPPTQPVDPSELTATAVSANQTPSQINIVWTDNSDNENSFKIERCEGVGCANFTQITRLAPNTTTFSDIYLPESTTYRYRVRASNSAGSSDYSNEAETTTLGPSPPAAPTNLAATGISSTQINLTWTDNADNDAGVKIERCTGAGCTNFTLIAHLGNPNVTTFSNALLFAGTTYRYRVRATNPQGDSGYSNLAEATTQGPPPAPTNLTASRGTSKGSINLRWSDNSSNETGFRVYRCMGTNCTPTTETANVAANATTYTDVGLTLGKTYSYRVRAYDSAGNSAYSNIASAKVP